MCVYSRAASVAQFALQERNVRKIECPMLLFDEQLFVFAT